MNNSIGRISPHDFLRNSIVVIEGQEAKTRTPSDDKEQEPPDQEGVFASKASACSQPSHEGGGKKTEYEGEPLFPYKIPPDLVLMVLEYCSCEVLGSFELTCRNIRDFTAKRWQSLAVSHWLDFDWELYQVIEYPARTRFVLGRALEAYMNDRKQLKERNSKSRANRFSLCKNHALLSSFWCFHLSRLISL